MTRDKFRSAVIDSGYTLHRLAFEMGISDGTMTRKIKTAGFTIAEADKIGEILHKDPADIFFTQQVT